MKNFKLPLVLVLVSVLVLVYTYSCEDSSRSALRKKHSIVDTIPKNNIQTLRAQHVDSQIATNIVTFKSDKFQPGDTVWTKFNDKEQYLEVIYNYPVDMSSSIGSVYFKVRILPEEDSIIEVYTPEDILFLDLRNNRVYSESGQIDETFSNRAVAIDYLSSITSIQSNQEN